MQKKLNDYEQGVQDMFDAIWKIDMLKHEGGYSTDEIDEIFNSRIPSDILRMYAPMEIVNRIQNYEDAKNLHVGDVVLFEDYPNPELKGVVIGFTNNCDFINVMWANGHVGYFVSKDAVTKIQGEHIDLGYIFEKLGGK